MRVVLNLWSLPARKTGIGHYCVQLLHDLHLQAEDGEEILVYPPPWVQPLKAFVQRCGELGGRFRRSQRTGGAPSRLGLWLRESLRRCSGGLCSWHFRRWCARQGVDVYHEPNYLPMRCPAPTVVSLHDLSVLLHPEWQPADRVAYFQRVFPETLARAEHFITGSEFTRQEILRTLNLPPERVTRVYYGIHPYLKPLPAGEVTAGLQRLGLPPRYLLHVGTIEPRKNLLLLLRAYCALPEPVRRETPLVLVGKWGWNVAAVAEFWQNEARHRGVLHLGYVADADLPVLYNGACALAFPSLYEGFGFPPLEMMACGGAVLASTAGAVVETVGSRAHLLDPHDLEGWRDALARVATDMDWWRSLQQGVVELAGRFCWQDCAAGTLALYRSLHRSVRAAAIDRAA
jgi:alpha-1,3-rhamnosyl/mannosyltransferase